MSRESVEFIELIRRKKAMADANPKPLVLLCKSCGVEREHRLEAGPVWTRFTCACGHEEHYRVG